ncbi:MAG TPA: FAD-linked oxidase C-terminal domain-containing protein [Candidatus Hydrogenedens sp.]|nr:FAD-linked oxidase C-terminal domain-containing protein [Candidatus Hydrogenedens sp.]
MDWNKILEKVAKENPNLDLRTDRLSRWLYATDASFYELMPAGVAFPKNTEEAQTFVVKATSEGIPIIPRGAGSGLSGGALGEGLIIDMSRYMCAITNINSEARTVWAEAGVVLDNLNGALKPYGLMFGPDVATSSRATIGGMIANNSSGAFVHHYGITIDHVVAVEVITSKGEILVLDKNNSDTWNAFKKISAAVEANISEIKSRFHDEIKKRWPGYALDRYCNIIPCPVPLLGGSEGTLALITKAKLNLVPIPRNRSLFVFVFHTIKDAMESIDTLMQFQPASIEHIDDVLFNQTKGQRVFEPIRQFLELDKSTPKSLLFVEFFDPPDDLIQKIIKLKIGVKTFFCKTAEERNMLWEFRKAGLSLLTGMVGPAKPATGVEDTAVRPKDLPTYVEELIEIMNHYGVVASFYGHASAGLLHVRPVIDIHEPKEQIKFRNLATEVFALVRKYRGTFTGEHGVGMAHSEFIKDQIGEVLFKIMRQIKQEFDPLNLMNPGKIVDTDRFRFHENLRWEKLNLPFEPYLAFAFKDNSFLGNLEQCNGCGACRKETPNMCPTFIARHEEILSTRGRANIIRQTIKHAGSEKYKLNIPELKEALKYCLACRACTVECPSNVNMALLKAELLHALDKEYLPKLTKLLLSHIDTLGKLATLTPTIVNYSLKTKWIRKILEQLTGIVSERPLPKYATEPFHKWFYKKYQGWTTEKGKRGTIILWDDCFTKYHEPEIGKSAVNVLTSVGYQVEILPNHSCCGRPAFSVGNLEYAHKKGEHNLNLLSERTETIVFLEPSCFSMFYEDYKELNLEKAKSVGKRSILIEEFLNNLLEDEPHCLPIVNGKSVQVALHVHCHAKSTRGVDPMTRAFSLIPNIQVQQLTSACCGMAGAYGIMKDTYSLSLEVGEQLKHQIEILPDKTQIVASGTSCRQQISYLTNREVKHFIQLIDDIIKKESN